MKFDLATNKSTVVRVDREQVRVRKNRNVNFCGSSHPWGSCPAFSKICSYCQKKDHFASVCRKRMRDFGGKIVHAAGSDNADFLTFSLESSGECPTQDDWHASLKIADIKVNFKLDSGADCNVIPSPCLINFQYPRNRPASAKPS